MCIRDRYVYLAGPIAGCTEEEATEWREYVCTYFTHGIVGISPLRCEPLKEGLTYTDDGATPKMWSDPRAIATKNWLDTESCDLVLAYLPKELNDRRPSYGTVIEIGWAIGLRKPLIVVSDGAIASSPSPIGTTLSLDLFSTEIPSII